MGPDGYIWLSYRKVVTREHLDKVDTWMDNLRNRGKSNGNGKLSMMTEPCFWLRQQRNTNIHNRFTYQKLTYFKSTIQYFYSHSCTITHNLFRIFSLLHIEISTHYQPFPLLLFVNS